MYGNIFFYSLRFLPAETDFGIQPEEPNARYQTVCRCLMCKLRHMLEQTYMMFPILPGGSSPFYSPGGWKLSHHEDRDAIMRLQGELERRRLTS